MNTNMDWLMRRNVSADIIESFHIHTGDALGLENCLVIPVHTPDGMFSFNKYRRDPSDERKPKYLYEKGGKVTLYGLDHIKDNHETIVITEGELDTLVLWSMNIAAVTSTGGALSFQEEWIPYFEGKQVYVCLDNDDAGAEGMVKIHSYLPTARFIFVPEKLEVKDITDFVCKGGNFTALMETALSYPDETSIVEDMNKRSASWLPTRFHKAWIKKNHEQAQQVSYTGKKIIHDDAVLNAKEYPVSNLIKFNREKKALCPFHNESTPSLHYYPKTNSTYCFGGCGKAYDSIAIYQNLNQVGFRTAVEDLNRL
jgi:5S rRNA maturation endonuclease (ribonuclease M5)